MFRYIIKRLIQMIPLLIIISLIAFSIIRLAEVYAKADPLTQLKMNPTVTQETIDREVIRLGLNKPFVVRYVSWAKRFIVGDMGESYYYRTEVKGLIFERLTNTLVLGVVTFIVTWLIAIPLGIYLAVKQYSLVDQIASAFSYFFMGFPDFFLAIILLLFAATTGLFPVSGMTSVNNDNMEKIQSIYKGMYVLPKDAKVSPEEIAYNSTMNEKAMKSQEVDELKNSLSLDIEYNKGKISNTVPMLVSELPKLDIPPGISQKVVSEFNQKQSIDPELAGIVLKELRKLNYFTIFDRIGFIFKHLDKLFYHYTKYIPDVLYHLVLPAITLSLISIAGLQRRMRGNLLDVLNEDYIKTARAKGLPENVVIYKHAVRNSLNPIITLLGFEFARLLSGAAFVEILFTWPGLGQMMLEAVLGSDLNLVMAGLVISSIMLMVGNLLADILLALSDPRIKLEA